MIKSFLHSAFHSWASIAQEPGAEPGAGLKLWQTVTIFLLAPTGLFGVITVFSLYFSRTKTNK